MVKHVQARLQALLLNEYQRMKRFAMSLTAHPADADDLVQSVAEKLMVKKPQIPEDALPWLLKVCKNHWLDEVRVRSNRQRLSEQKHNEIETIIHPSPTFEEDKGQRIKQVMKQLPLEQRSVIGLVIVEGFSYGQAAEILEVPIGTVMSRLSRARQQLSKLLQEEY